MNQIEKYLKENLNNYLEELKEYLSISSISTLVENKDDMRKCADFVAEKLRNAGMKRVEIFQTEGHPLVYGEWLETPDKPTLLIYGHYDVQPVDPIFEWKTLPFEAVIKDGKIFARGADDNKGQNFIHIKSVEAFFKTVGALPLNVKFIIEGEEEIGSGSLTRFIRQNQELLKCDAVLVSDTAMYAPGIPAICYGLRGICFFEIELQNSNQDLHSGAFGGAVGNPINELTKIISKLHDKNGKVTIPNFYSDVIKISAKEKDNIKKLKFSDRKFAEGIGIKSLYGEKGYSTLERIWVRPTLDCNGISGGFTGQGSKTIIPAKASAKISMRLVPDQNPDRIAKDFVKYVKSLCPKSMRLTVKYVAGIGAVVVPTEEKAVRAASSALSKAFGQKTVYKREGGSIPIVLEFYKNLNVPVVLMGFGLDSDNIHSPNEHFHIENFEFGLLSSAYFIQELSK
ncbi:MAG: peptidase M20 [Ignavibacteria bacterium RBG_13_36_8]|nr:MAG: peptidase M20 [Ignavibacteria bacterium RBG_13_36_8]